MSEERTQLIAAYMSKTLRDERLKARAGSGLGYAVLIALFTWFQWNLWILAGIALADAIFGYALFLFLVWNE